MYSEQDATRQLCGPRRPAASALPQSSLKQRPLCSAELTPPAVTALRMVAVMSTDTGEYEMHRCFEYEMHRCFFSSWLQPRRVVRRCKHAVVVRNSCMDRAVDSLAFFTIYAGKHRWA